MGQAAQHNVGEPVHLFQNGRIHFRMLVSMDDLKEQGIPLKGIILNRFQPENPLHQDNAAMCEHLTGANVIARVENLAERAPGKPGFLPIVRRGGGRRRPDRQRGTFPRWAGRSPKPT